MISPGLSHALERWLAELTAVRGRSESTVEAYRSDLIAFFEFLQNHWGERYSPAGLAQLKLQDMRAWKAHERGRGLGARSLARALSAVKNFVSWTAEREGFDPSAVLMTRSPKFARQLPRPLAPDAARTMIDTVEMQAHSDWIARRDSAVVTLLYGCALRISEARALLGDPEGEAGS